MIQHLPQSQGDRIDSLMESGAYTIIKQFLVGTGYSESEADCITTVLKFQGVTDDVADIRNILKPDELIEKVKAKVDFASSMCENAPLLIVVALIVIGMMCCCFICCCCKSKQKPLSMPATINLSVPYYSHPFEIPYERVDNV